LLRKIWSRWRNRNRSLQSLNIVGHRSGEKLIQFKPERALAQHQRRYDENAPGPFYVERDQCIACRCPETVAPDLIGFAEGPGVEYDHCYFKKQPETPGEMDRAIKAFEANCCGSYRYSGDDASIRQRLRRANCADAIDHP